MILDAQNELSDSQAVTATAISTNVIDLGAPGTPIGGAAALTKDLAKGRTVPLTIQVDTSATAAGAATVTFSVETDSTADLATSPTVAWTSAAIGKATLVEGYEIHLPAIPIPANERYLGVRYTVATGPLTAGAFSAFIPASQQTNE